MVWHSASEGSVEASIKCSFHNIVLLDSVLNCMSIECDSVCITMLPCMCVCMCTVCVIPLPFSPVQVSAIFVPYEVFFGASGAVCACGHAYTI